MRRSRIDYSEESKIDIPKKKFKTIAKQFKGFSFLVFLVFGAVVGQITALPVYAEALPDLPLIFESDITFADNVISFPAAAGTAITNTDVLSDIYTNFSGSGYGVADLAYMYDIVDSSGMSLGMTTDEIFSHLGDEEYFTENGYDLKLKNYDTWKTKLDNSQNLSKYGAEFIHEATLSTTGNPWEWDWAEIIKTYLKRGDIPFSFDIVQKDIGTTITKTFLDVLDTVIDFWSPNIKSGAPITFNIDTQYEVQNGSQFGLLYDTYYRSNYQSTDQMIDYMPEGVYLCTVTNGSIVDYYRVNLTNTSYNYTATRDSNLDSQDYVRTNTLSNWTYNMMLRVNGTGNTVNHLISSFGNGLNFNTTTELSSYINSVKNGTAQPPSNYYSSPDLINPNFSNLEGEDLERMSPSIEQGKAIRPIPQNPYNNFANTANGNTEAGNAHNNGPLLENLLNPYIDTNINPQPTTVPFPTGVPSPDTQTRPYNPEQPDLPEEPELTDEQIEGALQGVTPDLTEIFPFCLPFDIYKIFTNFTANRQAPRIQWTFESELFGFSYDFDIDLAMFDTVAALLRTLELILFIVGLAVMSRSLIGAGG